MGRIEHLEHRVAVLDMELTAVRQDLRALRAEREAPPSAPAFVHSAAPPAPTFTPTPPPPAAPTFTTHRALTGHIPVKAQSDAVKAPGGNGGLGWEDLLAGRVMAWVGGSAVLIGLILFLALAISRGWIGEEARTAMAALASLLLVAGGARAYERRGRTEAAVAAAAAGAAGGFATLAVATEVYALVPAAVGLPLGLGWGATAALLALRWRSPTMAVLGIAGGLLSPVLAGADLDAPVTIALLGFGYAGAAAVCVTLGWAWLGLLAFAIVTPQWAYHAVDHEVLLPVVAFGALGALAATGFQLRSREQGFGTSAHLLLALNAAVTAAAGFAVLEDPGHADDLWLLGVAAVHAAGGVVALATPAVARALALSSLGIGIVLADIAFTGLADGLALPLVWAASAVVFGLLARHEAVATLALGGHLALAIGHVLEQEAPYGDFGGGGSAAGLTAVLAIAAACLVSGRLSHLELRRALDVTGLLALAYATGLAFEGGALAAAWAAEAAALGVLARHGEPRAQGAAWAFLIGAVTATIVAAPPHALALGLDDAGAAVLALLAVAAAAPAVSREQDGWFVSGLALLYLASTLVVTAVDGQSGQLALSALWGVTGLAALFAGVVRDHAPLRAAALTLLAVATAKVFVVDLASLDSLTRVGSFLVLGTLLLGGAFAWQRARPS